ncbi:MAG: peptide-N-glycosidase F-related protein [Bacteroidia bacterium]
MKSLITTCFIFFSIFALQAEDTTHISSHEKVVIKTNPSKGFTEYPESVKFPADSIQYRKAYLYLEFGCAPGLKCGEWDYINNMYIEKDSIRYELARFITPYGFYWNSGMNWKHSWYFDITDYSFLLHDSATVVYRHSGYEGNTDRGWTVTMDFHLIHGDAYRIPMGYQELYRRSARYGDPNSPFDSLILPKKFTMPANSDMVNFKVLQTGHGNDGQACAEFCSRKQTLKLDNSTLLEKQIWRDNCGFNSLYPQAGTWIYDRGNWCPGAPVESIDKFAMISDSLEHEFHLQMENANSSSYGGANYSISAYAQFFKDNRKQLDGSLEDIIAPSTHPDYLRYNPTCGAPIVRVKNTGIDSLHSVQFEYGKEGGKLQTIWVPCNIAPFETQDLTLESIYDWSGSGNTFVARIIKVNGSADMRDDNNKLFSEITNSQTFPNKIIINFKSNSAPSENYYTLKDSKGNVIRNVSNFDANKLYKDTVYLENNICYTFEFFDDGTPPSNNPLNKDGLDWWANSADGSGYIQIRNGNSNAMLKNFNADFGTKHILNFHTTFGMSIDQTNASGLQLDILPNPSNGDANIHVTVPASAGDYTLMVYNQTGQLISNLQSKEASHIYELKNLSSGLYTVSLLQGNMLVSKKFIVR